MHLQFSKNHIVRLHVRMYYLTLMEILNNINKFNGKMQYDSNVQGFTLKNYNGMNSLNKKMFINMQYIRKSRIFCFDFPSQ